MKDTQETHYRRIEASINYAREHFRQQPSLEQMSAAAGLSPFYFQRVFTKWAGVSPKAFLQYLSVDFAKQLISQQHPSLLEAAHETGLSGTGRLHDLFIKIEGMTPGDYKNGGENLEIHYQFADSLFGPLLIASTAKGICHLSFESYEMAAINNLQTCFPNAELVERNDDFQRVALSIFRQDWEQPDQIRLHLRGTPFQLKVWQALLTIPMGQFKTYGILAQEIEKPKAARAVGSAIGCNPVAFLIPCHRVIRASGQIGDYRWGQSRKSAMMAWEAARTKGD